MLGEYRLIHHLLYPKGASVNDAIPPELGSFCYVSLDDMLNIIKPCGPRALLAKCDIQSAFHLLPVHPDNFGLLEFKFKGSWYIDKTMPMGCMIVCTSFEKFSMFLQ